MPTALKAGLFLGFNVFAIGFVFGTIRVLVVEDAFGQAVARGLELPLIILATWFVALLTVARFEMVDMTRERWHAGLIGFLVLQIGEILTGVYAFGRPLADVLAAYGSGPGLRAALVQTVVIFFPVWVLRRPKR
jgi:hypothetical protein